ncbi:MAG: hypothetical protein IPM06_15865 [Rhizobiales bacterium]|nr:hypothetical protein [Hyphomicrobiales bacterium]
MGQYPCVDATGGLELARQYRTAAFALAGAAAVGVLPLPPFRLLSIHAVELAMNAVLLHGGNGPAAVRGLQHNLAARLEPCRALGLVLKKRTEDHIRDLSENRDYLIARYAPHEAMGNLSVNRMTATVVEVCSKAEKLIASPKATT